MQLKRYQQDSLDRLKTYLEMARLHGNADAYSRVQAERMGGPHFPPFQALDGLESIPYVCLRLPTGGGKTLLCAHTIGLAGKAFLGRDHPLVLWLVPTTTIKTQTLETLLKPSHPNSRVLQAAFGSRFRVFDIADFVNLRPQDVDNHACIVLATFASLRVENTEGRRAYDHHEELEGHFSRVSPHAPHLERDGNGQIKYSFVNLLNIQRPLVLVDEAHNAKSDLSMEVLRRINPAAVIEYTATPAKNSNVIQSVTAAQLKAEHMIKLPIMFASHLDWQAAVTTSIQTRARLERIAQKDADYIRPLVLFQAENKGGQITVEVLQRFLLEQENILPAQIAIATGEQHELDGLNLFDPNCPVRYIITVQALKEGWDCSFAYVLCSVANTRSPVAVEQLLGRVLRMPYAQQRSQMELNQAYAHVSAQSWPHAVSQLTDRLVNMGFEKQEADHWVYVQPTLGLDEAAPEQADHQILLTQPPDIAGLDAVERAQVNVQETPAGYLVKVPVDVKDALLEKIACGIHNPKDRREWALQGDSIIRQRKERLSPAERGEAFIVPQLCLRLGTETVLLEKEECLGKEGFDPLEGYTALTLDEFSLDETSKAYLADIKGEKVKIAELDARPELEFTDIETGLDATSLAANLARNLYLDVGGQSMRTGAFLAYLNKTVKDLLARGDMTLPKLVRGRFALEQTIKNRLNHARHAAYKTALRHVLLADDGRLTIDLKHHGFRFPVEYPAHHLYDGHKVLEHHYYPVIGKMNGEEADCAAEIDRLYPKVKHWVRNLERQLPYSFSLPTSSDWFYPDFVAQLDDGRLLVVEYKGKQYEGSKDTQEKEMVGQAWAKISGNLFLMLFKQDGAGRDMRTQLQNLLG